ncbi:MAG TPA: aspartate--tRNA ligase [Pirellulaceae bacterium]|nr:aspartate--tRNA ligase [Pirellulaceae bacterium]
MLRTHTCGELRPEHVGQEVTLCGWLDHKRDHGGGVFLDLRDRYGTTQVLVGAELGAEIVERASKLERESVAMITGKVEPRPAGQDNPKLATGGIEVKATAFEILNPCPTPPFFPGGQELPGEELRLKYRFLDLRRKKMQDTLALRSGMIQTMRAFFHERDFLEVETPMLGRSTPEGARDFLVPSRVHPGHFYALPQSPQLYKQILMVAGYDRYVQIARCFRDEDQRADRQLEFTQLDLEMSFVDSDDVMGMIDELMVGLAKEFLGIELKTPLPRMTYDDAMRLYGHDAPDLRFDCRIFDCTDLAKESEFRVFKQVAEEGNFVRGFKAPGAAATYTRRILDGLTEYVQHDFGAKGLAWFRIEPDGTVFSPIAKNFSEGLLKKFVERFDAQPGDLILFCADTWEVTCKTLNGLRRKAGADLKLYDPAAMHFSWIVEFPMFDWDAEEKRWVAMHHPFTAPLKEHRELLKTDPKACRAQAYDLVINGFEAGGGTIRIHDGAEQSQVFELLGIDENAAREKFGFLLDALKYGAPPHGGIALGIDRTVMLFAGLDNIRDCIAFPKTQKALDLMTEAPGTVDPKQLRELSVRTTTKE